MHWLITTRPVQDDRVLDTASDATPTFRVAQFSPHADAERSEASGIASSTRTKNENEESRLRDAIRILPDSPPGSTRLFKQLHRAMRDAPVGRKDTLVFIHGFNYRWSDSLAHLAELHRLYVAPRRSPVGRIVYIAWPSAGSLTAYHRDAGNARVTGQALGRLLAKLRAHLSRLRLSASHPTP